MRGRSIRIGVGLAQHSPDISVRLWNPRDLGSKLAAWLRASDLAGANGSQISTWTDQSSNGNNATGVTTTGAKPTLNTTGGPTGSNAANLDSSTDGSYFTLPSGLLTGRTGATGSASYVVYKLNVALGNLNGSAFGNFGTSSGSLLTEPYSDNHFYSDYCSTTRHDVTGISATADWMIISERSKTNDWQFDLNGSTGLHDTTNTFGAGSAPTIGKAISTSTTYLGASIHEWVDCNDFLTTAEHDQLIGYLAWNAGRADLLPAGHTYKGAAPTIAVAVAASSSTGTHAATEADDTTSASGTVAITGSAAATEANDAGSGTATAAITGSAASADAADTTSATGAVSVAGTAASTEASDSTAATGAAAIAGSGASTESADTSAASGTTNVSGTAASSEGGDTTAAMGAVSVTGAIASTEAVDTTSGTGTASVAGSGAASEASDAASSTGAVAIAGSAASTEANDNGDGTGTVAQTGSTGIGSSTEANDTGSASGTVSISASGSPIEANDIAAGTGTIAIAASGSGVEASDTGAATGTVQIIGSAAANDNDDTGGGVGAAVVPTRKTVLRPASGPNARPIEAADSRPAQQNFSRRTSTASRPANISRGSR